MNTKLKLAIVSVGLGLSLVACTADQVGLASQVLNTVGTIPTTANTPNTVPNRTNTPNNIPTQANANGRYSGLLQVVNCPSDSAAYGNYREWGHWTGTTYCNQNVQSGYWVWVAPNWYIWKNVDNYNK